MSRRKINFGAGPAKIPEEVLLQLQAEQLDHAELGLSVLEMSQRSEEFVKMLDETVALIRKLMGVPDNFEVLFMQGGATAQFSAIPLNLKGSHNSADYIVTGRWSAKAAEEAEKYMKVNRVFTPVEPYTTVEPEENWKLDKNAAYLYYCANETVHGIEFTPKLQPREGVLLVADISSTFLARPFDFTNHGLVYGGTQKNLGAAGLTIVIIRDDLIGKHLPNTPSVFCYKEMFNSKSLFNTLPTGAIRTTNLVLKWIEEKGGVQEMYRNNLAKSALIYSIIDKSNGFYRCAVDPKYRSITNICFRIADGNVKLEEEFLTGAKNRDMINLKGHRCVGDIRASLYNAISMEETRILADWMIEFKENATANGCFIF